MKRLFLTLTILMPFISTSQYTFIPDDNFELALLNLGFDFVLDDQVETAAIDTITYLYISGKDIADLTGIEDFILLEELFCDNNQLTMLDLSNNSHLVEVVCAYNNLVQMDVRNGNNQGLFYFMSMFNPSLNCIDVDDIAWADYNWAVDSWTSFSNNCNPSAIKTVSTHKKLIKVVDIQGRAIRAVPNIPLIYIYSDGTVEKKIFIE